MVAADVKSQTPTAAPLLALLRDQDIRAQIGVALLMLKEIRIPTL